MARGKGSATSGWDEHHELLQYLLYIFNTVFFAAGAGVFAMCLYIRFDTDMGEYVDSLGLHFYWRATNTVMVASTLVMINCFLACCGSYYSNKTVIVAYIIMTFITFVMLIAGSAYVLANGLESSNVYPYIQKTMRELIYRYQWDVAARRSVDIIQEYVGCCGGYSSSDFTDIHLPVPNTCRDQVTGNQYGDSCAEIFAQYLEVRTGWLTGLSLCLCFFQCFAVMISICMYMAIRERDEMKRDRM
ncbi:tetraspanin-2A-like isoform X2 [Eriocheir sinensis]|uniref:tetraspanin-2A-like isoform X2 n=1 Tax=Eriocheir sinensis TaxID=95602 RepID=UPI0021C610C4|nr:tetraspanin-2A-like isoform X2 [Eriocheir sinensis]